MHWAEASWIVLERYYIKDGKKGLSDAISNPVIDEYYEQGLKAGALGGKLLGAGGGGFLMFYCEPKYQDQLRKALKLRELEFQFDNEGAKLIYFGL